MHQLRAGKVPENLRPLFRQRLVFISSSRTRIMIPLFLLLMSYYLIRSLTGIAGGAQLDNNPIVDAASLAVMVVLAVVFFLTRPDGPSGITAGHSVFQKIFAMSIIIWGAVVTRSSIVASGGGDTLIICLLITSALLMIELRYIIFCFSAAVFIIFTEADFSTLYSGIGFSYQDLFLIGIAFVLSIIINYLSADSVARAFILEQQLENEVAKRTRELADETAKAHRSDELKTVFLANMSHEIRTPLNGILGFSNLLRDERLKPETRKEYVDIILKSGNTLLEILNGIIEVARIESGEVELYIEEFCLNDLLYEILAGFRGNEKIRSDRISLVNKMEDAEPLLLVTDRLKLVQIMMNLVSNALKYTESGVIAVEFRKSGDNIFISVEDTGCGIRKEDQHMIFGRFQQTETAAYSPKEGVGLGLTIVKAYMDLLSGDVLLDSELERGSVFTLRLPLNFYDR